MLYPIQVATEIFPPLGPVSDVATIQVRLDPKPDHCPVAVQLPMGIRDATLFRIDPNDVSSVVAGARKRVVPKLHPICPRKLARFRHFVGRWIKQNLTPLASDTDVSREAWLEKMHGKYPAYRIEELRQIDLPNGCLPSKYWKVRGFTKDEAYSEVKHMRMINPRSDESKCFAGPIFSLIENEVFKKHWFIKKVPNIDRPNYIMEHVFAPGAKYAATDYSSFEASFSAELMESCEMQLYKYMSQHLDGGKKWYDTIHAMMCGMQDIRYKGTRIKTVASRMSGEMCTSLGNGFTNLMLMLFAGAECGLGKLFGVFEGDDGLFRFSTGRFPTSKFFQELGFSVKMEIHETLNTASFCGMVFDPEDKINVTDPVKSCVNLTWAPKNYIGAKTEKLRGLVKDKAVCYAHQYPGCPIVSKLAIKISELYKNVDDGWVRESRGYNLWNVAISNSAHSTDIPVVEPSLAARKLMEQKYGISVQSQLAIEQKIENLRADEHLESLEWVPLNYHECFANYTNPWVDRMTKQPILAKYYDRKPFDITGPRVNIEQK